MSYLSRVMSPSLRIVYAACISSAALTLFPETHLLAAITIVLGWSLVLPIISFGYITRFILSLVLLLSASSIVALVFWALGVPLSATLLIVLYAIVLGTTALLLPEKIIKVRKLQNRTRMLLIELLALGLCLVAFSIPLLPVMKDSSAVSLVRLTTFTDDNVVHINIVREIDKYHQYLYGSEDAARDGTSKDISAYPQGWHFTTSVVEQFFSNSHGQSPRALLLGYYLTATMWVGVLAYMFVILTHSLSRTLIKQINATTSVAASVIVGSSIFIGTIYPLFTWGAHPQIAVYSLLLTILLFIDEHLAGYISRATTVLLIASISTAIALFYYFELPIMLFFLALMLMFFYKKELLAFWRHKELLLVGVLVLVSIVPLLLAAIYGKSGQSSTLNADGGTMIYNNYLLVSISLLVLVYTIQKKSIQLFWAGLLFTCALIFMVLIMVYQYISIGSIHYYAFKASQIVIFIGALIFAAFVSEMMSKILLRRPVIIPSRAYGGLLLLMASAFALSNHSALFDIYPMNKAYGLDESTAQSVVLASHTKHPENYVSIGNCASYFDVRATRMVMAIAGKASSYQAEIASAEYNPSNSVEIIKLITDYGSRVKAPLLVATPSQAIQQKISGMLPGTKTPNFILLSEDLPAQECPLRIQ